MDLKEALTTAIGYETKVHDHYSKGEKEILSPQGKKVFATLAKEELGHLAYLKSRLDEWHRNGKISTPELATILPSMDWIDAAKARVERDPERTIAVKDELELLKIALELERQTGAFYRQLVETLPSSERPLFARFLEIENCPPRDRPGGDRRDRRPRDLVRRVEFRSRPASAPAPPASSA